MSLLLFVKMHRVSHWLYKKLLNLVVLRTDPIIKWVVLWWRYYYYSRFVARTVNVSAAVALSAARGSRLSGHFGMLF